MSEIMKHPHLSLSPKDYIMTEKEVLQKCKVEGNIVKLPEGQLDRKLYQSVAKSLNLIGGKWVGRKTMGFVFQEDPTELLEQIANGEKRNLKKEFQFFETPDDLADELVKLANLDGPGKYLDGWGYHRILEPSAGQGAIIKAIHRFHDSPTLVYAIELMGTNSMILKKIENVRLSSKPNFLDISTDPDHQYERIIANPPFTKNQDIAHIYKMYEVLKPRGRMVSIASLHWRNSSNKKETEFEDWLAEVNATIYPVERGTFKASGTLVGACIIIIDKL